MRSEIPDHRCLKNNSTFAGCNPEKSVLENPVHVIQKLPVRIYHQALADGTKSFGALEHKLP